MRPARRLLAPPLIAAIALLSTTTFVARAAEDPAAAAAPRVRRDVPYAVVRAAGKTLPLDLYVPAPAVPHGRPLPVVLWLHGGGWLSGDKAADVPVGMFTRAGYALASVNYRLSATQGRFPAQIQDVKAAVRWVRANARGLGLDPTRIAVCGISSGGHLAALLGTSGGVRELEDATMGNPDVSSRAQAVVDLCGPTDPFALAAQGDDRIVTLLGGPPSSRPELARQADPVTFASADDPPFLILHGEADRVVPPIHSRRLAEALRRAGAPVVTLMMVPNADHVFSRQWPFVTARTLEFLDRHLKR